ncbi:conjugal transfer protein [Bacillus altitudinis]|uniref:conjugal transfer protein n=1 Tax=Bacillus altitudinis TaxID=293387 RepID=UPI0013EE4324|nr:conjugal transfer protein [Bacillus altitudinis]QII23674.1 conjugal transfer protein [Bacillus altitudinis]
MKKEKKHGGKTAIQNNSLISAFKKKLKSVKKPEKKPKSIPKDRTKIIAVGVWSLIGTLVFFAFLAVLLSIGTRSALNDIERQQTQNSKQKEEVSIVAGERFLSGFITEYINIKNENDAIEQRRKKLMAYLVKESDEIEQESLFDISGAQGDRVLNNYNLYNVKQEKEETLFQYEIEYSNIVKVKKKEHEIKKQALLNIPVKNKGDQFAVSGTPYISEIYDLKGDIANAKEDREEYDGDQTAAIKEFVNTFFRKYAEETKDDMSYVMKTPETLNGHLVFSDVENVSIYKNGEGFEISSVVIFKEKETNIPVKERFTLFVTKNSGQYYVNKLKHK